MPAQATPTSVAIGPYGYYYVGELRAFPGPTGESTSAGEPQGVVGGVPEPGLQEGVDGGFQPRPST